MKDVTHAAAIASRTAISTPRPSCCPCSTTSCASSPGRSSRGNRPVRRSTRPPWFTKPTCGWSGPIRRPPLCRRRPLLRRRGRGHAAHPGGQGPTQAAGKARRPERRRVELNDGHPAPPEAAEELLRARRGADHGWRGKTRKPRAWCSFAILRASRSRRRPPRLGISRATAYRHWTFARAWLLGELAGDEPA